jgi:hypothetical protein
MSSPPKPVDIAKDATWLAQALDPSAGVARMVAMDRDSYRAASFLDDRMLQAPVDAQLVAWPEVEAAMGGEQRRDARWIFHIGHVGSTLLSRLLGEIEGVLAVREPRLLRDMALVPAQVREQYIDCVPKLMSRTFVDDEFACVKATSFVSEIAPQLVPAGERALFMTASPRNYIASILAGENSVRELHSLAPVRTARLRQRGADFPAAGNDAALAAIAWACETIALESAAEAMADRRIGWADFDAMLTDMPAALARVAEDFGFAAEPGRIREIAEGPLMGRYSKGPEHAYSAALRGELIAEATAAHGREIDDALAMLGRAAEKSPLLARALGRAGEA